MAPRGTKRDASPSSHLSQNKRQAKAEKDGGSSKADKFDHTRIEEKLGIVNRTFYPAEMSNERCERYNRNEIPRPIETLEKTINSTADARKKIACGNAVVHWFKRDLRLTDNHALSLASQLAAKNKVPLICIFIISPQDYEAHATSPIRIDFELRTLEILKKDLQELNIPLLVETVNKRKQLPKFLVDKCKSWGASHVFCNMEYEVDELRREEGLTKTCLEAGINFTVVHDDVIVSPGALKSGSGGQYAVYSPWYKSWVKHIHAKPSLLDEHPSPSANGASALKTFDDIFSSDIPSAPASKSLDKESQSRFAKLWPAGEHAAHERLEKFIEQKIRGYSDKRNFPAEDGTAKLSVHLATGTIAARTAIRAARDANSSNKLDGGQQGIMVWISEVAWRDFYKHVLAHWPYVCMHKPFKHEYSNIRWDYDDEAFEKWTLGRTGFPIVDAAMRQMKGMGYMHNRCRMIVASFLAKDLLLDWRLGERHFMLSLIDADFASNSGGWGFGASVGVDPQPYFRIFNPLLQSEKFDPSGDYIRKWVEELRDIKGSAIHDPYGRGAEQAAKKAGYPRPMVEHKAAREKALSRYKEIAKKPEN